jgi:hypothetical protein
LVTSRREEDVDKGYKRVNVEQILCAHVCKWKIMAVETTPGMERGGIKANDGGGEFKYDIL